jgi:hypothetical protein
LKTSNILLLVFVGVSVILAIVVYFYCPFYKLEGFDKGLEGVLLFSSISLGFYGACLSVIASIFNTKIVKSIMSEKGEKKEFSLIVFSTLITGFVTVFTTIAYRVILASSIWIDKLDLINSIWIFFVMLYVSMNMLFIILSFLIFLNNGEEKKQSVYVPKLKG